MTINLSHIRGVVWDLDGTLYRYNDYFIEACNIAAAQTVLELGLKMPYEEAFALARTSQKQSGNSFKLFGGMGIKYEDCHESFHSKVDHLIIAKNNDLRHTLLQIALPMTILTNASRKWALQILSHLDMTGVFGEDKILALEDVGFKAKAHHQDGFNKALSIMGLDAQDTLMVEDIAANLVIAKQMGMTTALVHQSKDNLAPHIDHHFDDALDLMKVLLKQ